MMDVQLINCLKMKKRFSVLFIAFFSLANNHLYASGRFNGAGWKAGVARVVITPGEPMWMAGYADRDHPSEGKIHDLWAKALVLEDAGGKQVVLITTDLCAIPKDLSDRIRDRLQAIHHLLRSQIILNCSHTHSGPVLLNSVSNIYTLDAAQLDKVKNYTAKLESLIATLVDDAFSALEPVALFAENGLARFQVNRRNNNEPTLLLQTELKGPNEYSVPVIKVVSTSGSVKAIVFGYACHNTVLNGYQWCGDYAGFAQLEIEKLYPGATALFFQGAGADQNPLPRRTVPLAKQYGQELAFAVEKVLNEDMRPLSAQLAAAYSEVQLPLNDPPSREELLKMSEESTAGYKQRSALHLLMQMDHGDTIRKSYPYPVQVWKLGDQPVIALGGEVVIQYAIELKKLFGRNTFVLGYSNDVMSYIPSASILRESNDTGYPNGFYNPVNQDALKYEGGLYTQMAFGLPSTWATNIESIILNLVQKFGKEAGVPLTAYK
jgi:neutral ceramidase